MTLKRALTMILALGVAAMVGVNSYLFMREIDMSPIRSAAAPAAPGPDGAEQFAGFEIPPDAVSHILARPLFNPGRRPIAQTAGAAAADDARGEARFEALTFVGTMRWSNTHMALIRVASEPVARWIRVGGSVDGWTLKGIERDFIVVERASRRLEIPIVQKNGTGEMGAD
ncbi:MAG: hypothetical protein AB7S70_02055 [Hyphomicrobium sp.]|uniref:hypothetical protein n=1 Tax=Hyphomicrobium sp. TaxID=82 RepID=UPI003D104AD4